MTEAEDHILPLKVLQVVARGTLLYITFFEVRKFLGV